jgi:hypothetical protein
VLGETRKTIDLFTGKKYIYSRPVLWIRIRNPIRIRKDPKLFAGSISGTRGFGSGSRTGLEPYQKSSKNLQFDDYDIKNTLIIDFH